MEGVSHWVRKLDGSQVTLCVEMEKFMQIMPFLLSKLPVCSCSSAAELKTFWLNLAVVMTCLPVQQYKQAKQHDWKQRRPADQMVDFKHQSVCILMEMNKNQICTKYMHHLCCNYSENPIKWHPADRNDFHQRSNFKWGSWKHPVQLSDDCNEANHF